MPTLKLTFWGGLNVSLDDEPVTGFLSGKVPALLCYLTVDGRIHQRHELAALLWPNRPDNDALTNLRQALANLRKLLEPYLLITRYTVAFNRHSDYWLDVADFVTAAQSDQADVLRQAADLYRGDFLQGFHVAHAAPFVEWSLLQREWLREEALRLFYRLAMQATAVGDYPAALHTLDRLLGLEPWREEAHRQKMTLLARLGQRSAALKQYADCRRVLEAELNIPPLPETTALAERIRQGCRRPLPALPEFANAFVGRETELAELGRLLLAPEQRLITLTGLGGVGKTRLALTAAAQNSFAFLDGVVYVPLAAVPVPAQFPVVLLNELGLPPDGRSDPTRQLLAYLQTREMLLLLDNFEHLLVGGNEAVELLTHILAAAPQVTLLVISRQRLNLRAEWSLPLDGLPFANEEAPALTLFWQRVAQANAQYRRRPADDAAAQQICQTLVGLPLGIEMAAAQTAVRSCVAIARQLAADLGSLGSDWLDLPPRQRSLRALFDYACALLPRSTLRFLPPLALFAASFTAAAAQAVIGSRERDLQGLAQQSLVQVGENGRYHLHPLIRQFAAERLAQDSDSAYWRGQFCAYYARLLAEHDLEQTPARFEVIMATLRPEWPHLRQFWQWGVMDGRWAELNQGLNGLYHFCLARSLFQEGRELLQEALATLPEGEEVLGGRIAIRLGLLHIRLGEYAVADICLAQGLAALRDTPSSEQVWGQLHQAISALQQTQHETALQYAVAALALAQKMDYQPGEANALNVVGVIRFQQGELAQAQGLYEQALTLFRALGDRRYVAKTLHNLATVYDLSGDNARALAYFQEALAIHQATGEVWSEALARNSLGFTRLHLRQYQEAEADFTAAETLFMEMNGRWGLAMVWANRCLLAYRQGDLGLAAAWGTRARQEAAALGDRQYQAYAAHRLGNVWAAQGDWAAAQAAYAAALALREAAGQAHLALESRAGLARVALAQGRLDEARAQAQRILPALPLVGVDEPDRVYETCYHAFLACPGQEMVANE